MKKLLAASALLVALSAIPAMGQVVENPNNPASHPYLRGEGNCNPNDPTNTCRRKVPGIWNCSLK
jgi:hypothetical protein